ncbi:MAG: substrate-binding domain-containing protein [Bacillota bacterium]
MKKKMLILLLVSFMILGMNISVAAQDDQLTVGVSTVTLRHQFFIDINEGIKEAAEKHDVELVNNDADVDAQKQMSAIEDYMQMDTDGLIVVGTDPKAIVPAVEEAAEQMPIVSVDMKLETDKVDSFVGTLNDEAGEELGQYTKEYIENELDGNAKIAIVSWLESNIQQQRVEGFENALEGMENVEVLKPQPGYDREESMNTVENILQSNPDIDIIYSTAENSVLGAKSALESSRKDDIKIVGFDLTSESADGIKDGTILAMIQQQPKEMGRRALNALVEKINGNEIDSTIPVPVELYDEKNIEEFSD